MDRTAVGALADDLAAADHAVALTGAGLSTASGIPDFRSEDGIWQRHDPGDFHIERFRADPGGFWSDRLALHDTLFGDGVAPNAAHEALATLESLGHLDALLTQNVDGLHAAAGSETVLRLHGTGEAVECVDCGDRQPAAPVRDRVADGERPPRCDCGGPLKPAVVLFGEALPEGALRTARRHAREADVFLAAGTSLTVEPVASLPRVAARAGATLAVVNLESTPAADQAAYDVRADVTAALPALVEELASEECDVGASQA